MGRAFLCGITFELIRLEFTLCEPCVWLGASPRFMARSGRAPIIFEWAIGRETRIGLASAADTATLLCQSSLGLR